jgi:hypothetical protein
MLNVHEYIEKAIFRTGRKEPSLSTLRRLAAASGLEMVLRFPLTREDRQSLVLHEAIARELERDPERVLSNARKNLRRMSRANPSPGPLHAIRAAGAILVTDTLLVNGSQPWMA